MPLSLLFKLILHNISSLGTIVLHLHMSQFRQTEQLTCDILVYGMETNATTLSTGVVIPKDGLTEEMSTGGSYQYSTRTELRPNPADINSSAMYLKWKWRMNLANSGTGLDNDALRAGVKKIADESGWKAGTEDWYDVSSRMLDYLVDNVQIGFSKYDYFPALSTWQRHDRPLSSVLWGHAADVDNKYFPDFILEQKKFYDEGCGWFYKDFDHSAPDWEYMHQVGFPGLKARIDKYTEDTPFYRAEKKAAAALIRFLDRLIAECNRECDKGKAANGNEKSPRLEATLESLKHLREGPPKTLFDVMEMTMVWFCISEPLNHFQVRTFDNIDVRWWPYYQRDIAAGVTTEAEFREQFHHLMWQFGSIDNYWGHPFYLGGTNEDGSSIYNPLSLIILDQIEKTALPTPKFQLKMAKNTPDAIWWKALDMLRKHCPLCLMSEENMARSMKTVGLTDEECRDLLIWGCFEYLPRGKGNCTSSSIILLPQPIVTIMKDAAEGRFTAETFHDFKEEYKQRIRANIEWGLSLLVKNEAHLAEVNPSLILSLAVPSALENGVDAFSQGYKYNFTSFSECGFATTVDSLLAIKEFVYGNTSSLTHQGLSAPMYTAKLSDFGKILANNWKGHEELRHRIKRSRFKWGCGNPEADALAKEIFEWYSSLIIGKPNGRGGKFVCYGLNSRGFIDGGRRTPATPDGRKDGEYLSKNMAPNVGAETEGISGSFRSFNTSCAPDFFPCGSIYDAMIHPSLVGGASEKWSYEAPDKGLRTLRVIIERFYAGGGIALNLNIVSAETLRDAQNHPDKYENLQVRVAGWNIRWNDIPRKEQNEYIARIECVGA